MKRVGYPSSEDRWALERERRRLRDQNEAALLRAWEAEGLTQEEQGQALAELAECDAALEYEKTPEEIERLAINIGRMILDNRS